MCGQHPRKSALRRIAPLATVLALLGPAAAHAAPPTPDAAPSAAAAQSPRPDPQPAQPAHHVMPRVIPRRVVAAVEPVQAVPSTPTPVVPKPKPRHVVPKPRHTDPVRVVNVVPLRVDVHRG